MNLPAYRQEPFLDTKNPDVIAQYKAALESVRAKIGQKIPLVIGADRIFTDDVISSVNPCKTSEIIGLASSASAEHANRALEIAGKAFESWKHTSAEDRANVLLRVAQILRERRLEFDALLTLEVGKNFWEAEGELTEAVDFLEFYARQALKFAEPLEMLQMPNERDHAEYIPLGVGVSITPWNFPLAIFLGQLLAPVAAGNAMIAKPAEESSVIAAWAVDAVLEAGVPAGVVNFLPGRGEVVGATLVQSPRTRFIAFTGSKNVGLWINAEAAKVLPGQRWIKRVTLELGGKDGMIVDETADLDNAADAAVAGAFGFAGQKCSALSRLIVVDSVHEALLERVKSRVEKLKMGAAEAGSDVNAVINEESHAKSKAFLEIARTEGRVVTGGELGPSEGYFVQPTVVTDVKHESRLAQEEIFGPILAVIPVADFDEAMRVINDTDYGLTGGLCSTDESRLERAEKELHVGNLYLNRKITGAMVGSHPFGGFNLSGTDSKAGGPDYLSHFLQMKSIARRV
jgi:1-pyrroline-5-carboxylate dehydrogenase